MAASGLRRLVSKYASGLTDSSVETAITTILTAAPTFSPSGGTYTTAQTVTLSSNTSGATIHYTLDGSTPSETAGTVCGAVHDQRHDHRKGDCVCQRADGQFGGNRDLHDPGRGPDLQPVRGTYTAAQTVTLSSTTSGATIRYTLDGSTPSETAGTVYTCRSRSAARPAIRRFQTYR